MKRWLLLAAVLVATAAVLLRRREDAPAVTERRDDPQLADRVRREVLSGGRYAGVPIEVSAAGGVVTLRGALPTPDEVRALRDAVARIEGVAEVHSYLHLPKPAGTGDAFSRSPGT